MGKGFGSIGRMMDPTRAWQTQAGDPLGIFGGKGDQSGPNLPSIPKFAMRKTDEFIKNEAAPQIGGPNGSNAINRRYSAIRESTANRLGASNRDASNAIQRKFASQGLSGSGAEIAAMQRQNDAEAAQKADVLAQVDIAESGEISNRDFAQADMDFKQKVFNFERGSKMHELDLAERQQQQDAVATEINALTAKEQMKPQKQGAISSMLGGIL